MDLQIYSTVKLQAYKIKWGIVLIFAITSWLLVLYWTTSLGESTFGKNFKFLLSWVLIYLSICLTVSHFFRHLIPYLIALSILFYTCLGWEISFAKGEYNFSEYFIAIMAFCQLLVSMLPTQWKMNSLSFALGFFYLSVQIYFRFGFLSADAIVNLVCGTFYFTISNYILHSNLSILYKLIRENEKLVNEMKRLFQVFPESVVIRTQDDKNWKKKKYFANHRFSTHIWDIQNEISKINSLHWTITTDASQEREATEIKLSLQSFLKQQEMKLNDKKIVECKNMKMKWEDTESSTDVNFESEKEEDSWTRYFTVKTLKVSWEGNTNAFLHVFVDVTDIRKLEEANNNIKCQKIMFASVSHEF